MKRSSVGILLAALRVGGVVTVLLLVTVVSQPVLFPLSRSTVAVSHSRLRADVDFPSVECAPRNSGHPANLAQAQAYILREYYPALIITDTAFFRNRAYHEHDDTAARLDDRRMGEAVRLVYQGVSRHAARMGALD